MPVRRRSFLPGNFIKQPDFAVGEAADMILPGFAGFTYEGYARVTTSTSNVLALANRADQPCIIPATAADPSWVFGAQFYIPPFNAANANEYGSNVITAGATDVLKLASSAAIDGTVATTVAATTPAATAGVIPSGEVNSIIEPAAPVKFTSDITLQIFSSTAAGAAGASGGNIRVATGWFWIPVRVFYIKRMPAPNLTNISFSDAQLRINADV